jgi:putative MATE family efflux protein
MEPTINATLIEGRVSTQLKELAVPMVWGLAATMTLNIIEVFFIARLGSAPLAALSFTFPILMVLTSLGIGLGAGTSSAVARAIGEGNSFMARRLATDAMTLAFGISVLVCITGWLLLDPLFRLLGATDTLMPLIRGYMSIWLFSAPCLIVPMVCLAALRAMGMSRVQGYLMGGAALVNVTLDPILIFGLLGAPALGLEGAAWATLITRFLMLLVALYILLFRVGLLVNPFIRWQELKPSWRAIVHVGVPAMAANVIVPLASAMVVAMVASYGTDAVAALGIAVRIEPLALIVFFALSGVVGPFFGQNLGAGKYDRLEEAIRVLTGFCLAWGLLLALILLVSGRFLAGLFTDHEGVIPVVVFYLGLVPFSYGAYGIIMSVNAAFNGMGRPWPAMALSAGRVLFVFLPLAFIGQHFWGLTGIFVATMLSNVCIGIWGWLWLRRYVASTAADTQLCQRSGE